MNTSTCIVAVRDGDTIIMGGDSAGVSGLDIKKRKDPKVFTKTTPNNEKMIIGYTSSFRMGQLLRFNLSLPGHPVGMDGYEYMCTKFIDAVRDCLKSGGFASKDGSTESGGTFIVGYRSEIYTIYDDYQVEMVHYSYNATGCGAKYAMGSLFSTIAWKNGHDRVVEALDCASEFSGGVCKPYTIESIPTTNFPENGGKDA